MARPVKQKKRKFDSDQVEVVKQETYKLFRVDFIREVQYPNWLSNVVMVKKIQWKVENVC